jgi:SAM-dependent methyltransferase
MPNNPASSHRATYILQGGDPGAARLRILGTATRATTLRLLARAGVTDGMRVLDLGCGSGEVAVELARLVGSRGRVLAIDADPSLLAHARRRVGDAGQTVELARADARSLPVQGAVDAAYARFLLTHLREPAVTIEQLRIAVRPGGVVIVEDIDFPGHFCHPPSPAFARYLELYQELARRRGVDPAIGPRLPSLLHEAGLEIRGVDVAQPTFLGDEDGALLAQLTVAGIRDAAVDGGLATADEIDRLVGELDAFRRTPGAVQSLPRIVQAWATRGS